MRRPLTHVRHGLLLAALLCVLLARVAVPAGWMPVAGSDDLVLAPCSGMGMAKVAAHAMPGMAMHASDKQERHPDPGGDHPCAGAGLSAALELPTLAVPRVLMVRPIGMAMKSQVDILVRGLAAPPPPPTGPPIFV